MVLFIFSASRSICSAKDETLVINQLRGGLEYKSEVVVKDSKTITDFQLHGFFHTWNCEAWIQNDKKSVLTTCWQLDEEKLIPQVWKTQVSIYCNEEDLFFIDAVTIKCQGNE